MREVNRSENNRYLFEITMKNGKKKMLVSFHNDQEGVYKLCLRMWSAINHLWIVSFCWDCHNSFGKEHALHCDWRSYEYSLYAFFMYKHLQSICELCANRLQIQLMSGRSGWTSSGKPCCSTGPTELDLSPSPMGTAAIYDASCQWLYLRLITR